MDEHTANLKETELVEAERRNRERRYELDRRTRTALERRIVEALRTDDYSVVRCLFDS